MLADTLTKIGEPQHLDRRSEMWANCSKADGGTHQVVLRVREGRKISMDVWPSLPANTALCLQPGHAGEALGSGAGPAAASTKTTRRVDGPAAGTAAGAAANGGPGTADGAPPNTTPNKMHGAAAPKTEEKGVNKMPKAHAAMEFPPRGA